MKMLFWLSIVRRCCRQRRPKYRSLALYGRWRRTVPRLPWLPAMRWGQRPCMASLRCDRTIFLCKRKRTISERLLKDFLIRYTYCLALFFIVNALSRGRIMDLEIKYPSNCLSAEETVTRYLDEGGTVGIVYLVSPNRRLLLIKLKCYRIGPLL